MVKKVYSYSGPEHYQLAENAIDRAENTEGEAMQFELGIAQVHATLALAAATALAGPNVKTEWRDILDADQ